MITASAACQVALKFLLWLQGVLGHTLSPVRQLFERIASPSAAADAESRFQHFKKHVWLRIKESGSSGIDCHSLFGKTFHLHVLSSESKQVSVSMCQVLLCCSACLCCAADRSVGLAWGLLAVCHRALHCKRAVNAAEHSLQACCECSF